MKEFEAWYVAVPADRTEAQQMVEIFRPLYENPNIMKIGQNIKYDYEVLRGYGVDVQGELSDTMLAHYIIQPEPAPQHGLHGRDATPLSNHSYRRA